MGIAFLTMAVLALHPGAGPSTPDSLPAVGVALVRPEAATCLLVPAPSLAPGTLVHGVQVPLDGAAPTGDVVTLRVGRRADQGCTGTWGEEGDVEYAATLEGDRDALDGSPILVVTDPAWTWRRTGGAWHLAGADGADDLAARGCTSSEGIHVTLWDGTPLESHAVWHRYVYLGYDVEPSCTEADYVGPSPPSGKVRSQRVGYDNPVDGTPLSATLALPEGKGPFPGVVALSLAGTDDLVARMAELGWAVLVPERRGMAGSPELQLRASFQDLANDVAAAEAYLRARPEVDSATVGLLAQGAETMTGMISAVAPPLPAFVVLMSVTDAPGDESFRSQQRTLARERGLGPSEVDALDRTLERLAEIVRSEPSPYTRAARIHDLLDEATVAPNGSSSFPPDTAGQAHFFSSTWWRDYFTFAPDSVLSRLDSPTLVLMGQDDPFVSPDENVPPIRRSLAAAPAGDVTLCVVAGRVQHAFTPEALDAITAWLRPRTRSAGGVRIVPRPGAERPSVCLKDPGGG